MGQVSFEGNIEFWRKARDRARLGAAAAATAGAKYLMERAQKDTLQRSSHPPGAWSRQGPTEPPARGSGKLIEDMFFRPAFGGLRATAIYGNVSEYGRILEWGCVVYPVFESRMSWVDSGGAWFHDLLEVPPHPYLSTTTDEAIEDGSLHDVMIDEFARYDP